MNSRQRGFTLLEVLLAGFILFLVLTSMTQIYQGALLSSERAENALVMIGSVPSIRAIVSDAVVEDGVRAGEGSYGEVKYAWTATLAYEGQPNLALREDSSGTRFFLWDVDLEIFKGSVVRQYSFRELGW